MASTCRRRCCTTVSTFACNRLCREEANTVPTSLAMPGSPASSSPEGNISGKVSKQGGSSNCASCASRTERRKWRKARREGSSSSVACSTATDRAAAAVSPVVWRWVTPSVSANVSDSISLSPVAIPSLITPHPFSTPSSAVRTDRCVIILNVLTHKLRASPTACPAKSLKCWICFCLSDLALGFENRKVIRRPKKEFITCSREDLTSTSNWCISEETVFSMSFTTLLGTLVWFSIMYCRVDSDMFRM